MLHQTLISQTIHLVLFCRDLQGWQQCIMPGRVRAGPVYRMLLVEVSGSNGGQAEHWCRWQLSEVLGGIGGTGAWWGLSVCFGKVVTAMVVEQATESQEVFHWPVEVRMLATYPARDYSRSCNLGRGGTRAWEGSSHASNRGLAVPSAAMISMAHEFWGSACCAGGK